MKTGVLPIVRITKLVTLLRAKFPQSTDMRLDHFFHALDSDYLEVRVGEKSIVIAYSPTTGFGISRSTADAYAGWTRPDVQCSDVESACEQAVILLTTEASAGPDPDTR